VAYGCAECCGWSFDFWMYLDPIDVGLGLEGDQDVWDMDNCTGTEESILGDFTKQKWGTGNTAIATANGRTITGVGVGSTTNFVSGDLVIGGSSSYKCPVTPVNPTGPVNSGPYQVEPIDTASQGPAQCPSGSAGWVRNVTNQLQYQDGSPYAVDGITLADTLSIGSTNQLGLHSPGTGQATTTGDGSFPDTYSVCSTYCPSSTGYSNLLQQWTAYGVPLPHVNGVVDKCNSITIDGN